MDIPIKEIEYLANFVEADTENDLYEISEAVMEQVNKVREWLKTLEPTVAPDVEACEAEQYHNDFAEGGHNYCCWCGKRLHAAPPK